MLTVPAGNVPGQVSTTARQDYNNSNILNLYRWATVVSLGFLTIHFASNVPSCTTLSQRLSWSNAITLVTMLAIPDEHCLSGWIGLKGTCVNFGEPIHFLLALKCEIKSD
jgi:hypothetical protein